MPCRAHGSTKMFGDQLELDRGKQSLICPAGHLDRQKKFTDQLELDRGKQ